MVVLPSCVPVMVKWPVVLPSGMLTGLETKLTAPSGDGVEDRVMFVPYGGGAGASNVIVPSTLCVRPTPLAPLFRAIEIDGFVTVTDALAAVNPDALAVS